MPLQLPPADWIRDYLLSFDPTTEERRSYLVGSPTQTGSLERIIKTLQLLPPLPRRARVLELGAEPFFMTILIKKYLGCDVATANYPCDYCHTNSGEYEFTTTSHRWSETHSFRPKLFNVELDPFPYRDGEFDLVLCCEILEHLAIDPSHMLREVHRILEPDGWFFLSTPNVTALHYIMALLRGGTIFHRYSGFGAYARHNREYTPGEVTTLLQLHNFEPKLIVDDVVSHDRFYRLLTALGPLRRHRDHLFVIARPIGSAVQRYPDWLYEQTWRRRCVRRNNIVMGDGDALQVGPGWYDLEDWPPTVRWTGREAVAFLKPEDKETSLTFRAHAGPPGATGHVWINDQQAGSFALEPGASQDVVVPLPDSLRAGIEDGTITELQVRLRVDNTFISAGTVPGSSDPRELGMAVERIWLA